jgi:hypothetical protein
MPSLFVANLSQVLGIVPVGDKFKRIQEDGWVVPGQLRQ